MHALTSIRVAAVALGLTALSGSVAALANSRGGVSHPGHVSAHVVTCTGASGTACAGTVEINGEFYRFAGGGLSGTVANNGRFTRGRASFGVAETDPATQGPFQLRIHPVALRTAGGGFIPSGSPLGVGSRYGLYFLFQVPLYIALSGSRHNPAGGAGAGIGVACTIGSRSHPIQAQFLPTLSGFFSGQGGTPYDQKTGTADLTATLRSLPGVQECAGQESALDQQLGLPGPGSIHIVLRFSPPVVSAAYRAAHPLRRRHRH